VTTAPDIVQVDLENSVGAANVARYFDDDGDGFADPSIVEAFLRRATARVRGLLFGAFREATVDAVRSDERYVDLVCTVALGMAAQRRPEWMLPDGSFPYAKQKKEAEAELLTIAKGHDRFAAEEHGGTNTTIKGSARPETADVPLVFAPTKARPGGPGGY
jgi:hypothetical protein